VRTILATTGCETTRFENGYHFSVSEFATTWAQGTLESLRDAGYRSGGARRAVVELLARQDCCMSAQEIFDTLRGEGRRVGIASVYRVLELLAARKLVQRLEIGDGVARYEPAHPGGEHHHHVVCDDCGKVEAFEDQGLEHAIDGLGGRLGFTVAAHDVVLRGACADCSAA
jgi:Fur family ferric uptake transcriptional regulator